MYSFACNKNAMLAHFSHTKYSKDMHTAIDDMIIKLHSYC